MKKIIVVVLFIIVITAVVPFLIGKFVENKVYNTVESANSRYADSGLDYSLEIIRYDRGYLSTDIEWKVKFGSLSSVYGIEEIILSDHAKHGYTGVISTTRFDKNPWFNKFIDDKLQGKNPFRLTTAFSVTGEIQSTFSFDSFLLAFDGGNDQFDIKEGKFELDTNSDLKEFKSVGVWQGVNGSDKVIVNKIKTDFEMEMLSTYIWDGHVNFSFGNFKAMDKKGPVECTNVNGKYLFNSDRSKENLSIETVLSMEKLSIPGKHINGANLKLALNNISAKGYEAFMKAYTQIMPKIFENMKDFEKHPEMTETQMKDRMREVNQKIYAAYENLLRKDIELRISDFYVKFPEGDITGDIALRLMKDMTLMEFSSVVGQPDLIFDIFYLKSDLRLPSKLIGEAPMLISPIYPGMQTGAFVKDGNYLIHNAETRDGKLFLNDHEVVLTQ